MLHGNNEQFQPPSIGINLKSDNPKEKTVELGFFAETTMELPKSEFHFFLSS